MDILEGDRGVLNKQQRREDCCASLFPTLTARVLREGLLHSVTGHLIMALRYDAEVKSGSRLLRHNNALIMSMSQRQ